MTEGKAMCEQTVAKLVERAIESGAADLEFERGRAAREAAIRAMKEAERIRPERLLVVYSRA